jgi:hypothetical protein
MPSTHSAAGNLVIVEPPAMAKTVEREPGRGFHLAVEPPVVHQPAGR